MNMNSMTLPKKGLKTRPYSMDMNKDIATLPKKGLKRYDYNVYMDMEKKDLKKLTKGQLIKLLLKQKESKKVHNHKHSLDNDPFKEKLHKSLQNESNHQNPLESHHLHQSLKLKIT